MNYRYEIIPRPQDISLIFPDIEGEEIDIMMREKKETTHTIFTGFHVGLAHHKKIGYAFQYFHRVKKKDFHEIVSSEGISLLQALFVIEHLPLVLINKEEKEGCLSIRVTRVEKEKDWALLPFMGKEGYLIYKICA